MAGFSWKKVLCGAGAFLGLWISVKYVFPLLLPFVFGALLALAAEPAVRFVTGRSRLPRGAASALAVSGVLVGVVALLSVLGAFAVRELAILTRALPDLQQTAREGVFVLQDYLINLSNSAPEGVRPFLTHTVLRFFSDGTEVLDRVADRIPGILTGVLGGIPDSALGLGTAILSGFMISNRLPKLKQLFLRFLPPRWESVYLPTLRRIRKTMGGWLKAQMLLSLITYGIVSIGFFVMKIPFAPAWAALVAVVDAVPLLGTGTVLAPCALVSFLQGNGSMAVGYLCLYGVSAGVRAALEPRLVGHHLGLDPLATLLALYVGYRFWGVLGLLLAPILTSASIQLINPEKI